MPKPIKQLIINSPFKEPTQHWKFNKTIKEFELKKGRRPASYVIAGGKNKSYDEFGRVVEIPLVNNIRKRVRKWREENYSSVTGVTRKLLEFWNEKKENSGRKYDFFFCQLEAIETLIFLIEASSDLKTGLNIPQDEILKRLCSKMATGTGKTVVMAMTIAWQILNKVTYPKDPRFSKNIFIISPNLTVRDRLNVLNLLGNNNYYREYKVVPHEWWDKLRQGKVLIKNWHQLMWETEEQILIRKGVDKRGPKSDTAYTKEVLEDMAKSKNIIVLNDEAHHAWRKRAQIKAKKQSDLTKEEMERATKWIEGLDRLNKTVGIRQIFDFSATPYAPTGQSADERNLFEWIVSDFSLTSAIESGLVKTPKFAVGDDASVNTQTLKPRLYHIYENEEVQNDLNRKAKETESLPDIVKSAYTHLSLSWNKTYETWKKQKNKNPKMFVPPVMISIVNRKETADRVEHGLKTEDIPVSAIFKNEDKILKIYSGMEDDDDMRGQLSAVGKVGSGGQFIHHVLAVQMLSEGWNCPTVTHIMGLRAFSSQLLCEQTVGRGLRRMSYELNEDGMFEPEYVNVLGVPFAYLPQEGSDTGRVEEEPRNCLFPEDERKQYKITWPNVERIDYQLKSELKIDFSVMPPYTVDVSAIPRLVELAPVVDGKPNYEDIEAIKLKEFLEKEYKPDRMQTLILKTTSQIYDKVNPEWKKGILKSHALKMIFHLVQQFIHSPKFQTKPDYEKNRKALIVMMKMNEIVNKVFSLIQTDSVEKLTAMFNKDTPFFSTSEMSEWWTKKKTAVFKKSHINQCVVDSSWEYTHVRELDKSPHVLAWVKNDHLGFNVDYIDEKGKMRNYKPDFIAQLLKNHYLILEVKGIKKKRDIQKWDFMNNWCSAVSYSIENQHWHFKISQDSTGGAVHKLIEEII